MRLVRIDETISLGKENMMKSCKTAFRLKHKQSAKRNLLRTLGLALLLMGSILAQSEVALANDFPLNISLSFAGNDVMCLGNTNKTFTATVTRQDNGAAVAGKTVSFSTTAGQVNPDNQTTDAAGTATTTLSNVTSASKVTVSASVSWDANPAQNTEAGTATATASVYVIGGDLTYNGTRELKYFCLGVPDDPGPIAPLNECSAPPQPMGTTVEWMTSEDLYATPQTSGAVAKIAAMAGTDVGKGIGSGWVQAKYTLNGVSCLSAKYVGFTVRQPSRLETVASSTNSVEHGDPNDDTDNYFITQFQYQLKDQFGDDIGGIPLNEKFGPWEDDMENDWPNPGETAYPSYAGELFDGIGYNPFGGDPDFHLNPPMVFTGDPPTGTTKVRHATQEWYAGSADIGNGCLVQSKKLQFYTDHVALE